MADLKISANGKASNRSTPSDVLMDMESDIREDIAAIKEDVVRLGKHLQSGNAHLVQDAKKALSSQMEKVSQYSRDGLKQMETHVREKPAQSVALAFGAGLLASVLLRR